MIVNLYDYQIWFEGRRIEEKDEPPAHFFQTLVQTLIQAMVLKEDILNHECKAECALNSFLIIGYPYAENLTDAVPE